MNQQRRGTGLPNHDRAWFTGAPTSKILLFATVAFHLYAQNTKIERVFHFDSLSMAGGKDLYRYLSSKVIFQTSGDLVVGIAFLFRFLRKYEREMGSRKFLCFYALQSVLSLAQECALLQLLSTRNLILDLPNPTQWKYAGPYALVGSLFILFHTYTPRVYPRIASILGFHFSEKSFYYIWFFYFAASNGWNTLIPTATGMASAVAYVNIPFLSGLSVPTSIVSTFQPFLRRIGIVEQEQVRPHVQAPRNPPPPRRPDRRPEAPVAIPVPEPDPEAVEQLTNMGFPRQQVMEALRQSHNNVDHAVHRLLGG